MSCGVERTPLHSRKVSEVGKANRSRNFLQLDGYRRSSQDSRISSFNLRNIDQRCTILTFPTLECNGQWRIVALPLQYFDHTNRFGNGTQVNMNSLHLVPSPSVNPFKVNGRETQKGPQPDQITYSAKPFRTRSLSGSNVQQQFRNRSIAHKMTKSSEMSYCSSRHSSITCYDSSAVISKGSNATMFIDCSEEDKSTKRNARKKARRKGKHKKKHSCDFGSSESEVCVEYACGSSASEICESSSGVVTSSQSQNTCTCDIDEVDTSKSILPSQAQKYGEHIDSSEISSEDLQQSRCQGDIERRHPSHTGSLVGIHQKDFSDKHDSLVLDSVSVGSNSEEGMSSSGGHIVNPFHNHHHEISRSKLPGSGTKKGSLCLENSLCSISKTCHYTEETKQGLARSCYDGRKAASRKQDKQFKSVPGKLGSMGNRHSRTGIENGHSVWQRVQKNDVEKCNAEMKKTSSICSQFDAILKDAPLQKRNCNAASLATLPITEDKRKLKNKVPRKLKIKVSTKQENRSYSRKETLPNKVNLNAHAKTSMPKSGILDDLTSLDDNGASKNHSRSSSQLGYARVETLKSESVSDFEVVPTCTEPCESVCDTESGLNSRESLGNSCVPLHRSDLLEMKTPVYLPHLMVNDVSRTEKKLVAENGKQSHNLGPALQKWIPIGIKESGFTSSKSANLSLEHSNGPEAEDGTRKNTFEEKFAPSSKNLENGNHIPKVRNVNSSINGKENNPNGANLTAGASDLNKIAKALNDGYRAQMASEAVQAATGDPIAEFERLLHFCSPVICHSDSSVGCENCLLDQVPSALLCRHETPKMPLGCLWKWYEKHGSYGLEIRAEDYGNTKRLGIDQVEFRAYFVPFLSAIQLFKNSKTHSSPGVLEACDTDPTSANSTNVNQLPILSALVPHPQSTEPSSQSQVNDVRSAVSPKDVKSVDMELVFEYFESEKPHQRQALYEKIQELARDDVSPKCKMYGDPVHLNYINMHDLHPRSWYSVAWYPIYKIPDGNFRAAFLTYHSLGHFVRRSSKLDYPSVDACVVSPVVGLKSYNAQGECWFRPRHSSTSITHENQGVSPSRILKERLRILDETASLMARAVVNKGNRTSVNRHPDYEFFVSRQR
ncbi:Kunitz family trypsin and protease inhibitor protein [Hibiscus syriacus]|uniref:Kunitz family trypsin and protease inhibitor protein n=1 Tax=Hibiscus syriacus TaxID=106335 RepID=A0A6A3D1M1_HIBSY|nr:uncharacterized protein LOC120123074 isoform X2 [Hibiscus syriacus]KAE8733668.1 Kunitz family trypsin and protease inhibitor protein [Hibiscus syriacus]